MEDKNKILFVDHDSRYSGATVSLIYILNKFKQANYELYIVTSKTQDDAKIFLPYTEEIHFLKKIYNLNISQTNTLSLRKLKGIYTLYLIVIRIFTGFFKAFSLLRKIRPDLVYINEYVLVQFSYAAKLLKIPVVIHIRSLIYKCKMQWSRTFLNRLVVSQADAIIGISELEIDQFVPRNETEKQKFFVIPEFLTKDDFVMKSENDLVRKKYKIPSTGKIVLMLGGIHRIKGSYEFIEAANEVIKRRGDVHFFIVGTIAARDKESKKYVQKCFEIIKKNNLENYIYLIGVVNDPSDFLWSSDILVSSNSTSHFSRPIIEAWAKKKAVIASDQLHAQNLIDNNISGLLYSKGNANLLAEAIINLLDNDMLSKQFGENGYQKALNEFNAEKNTERIIKLCEELI